MTSWLSNISNLFWTTTTIPPWPVPTPPLGTSPGPQLGAGLCGFAAPSAMVSLGGEVY